MNKPIRVLQYVRILDSGGIEAFIFANLRKIDRSKVAFDFLVTRNTDEFYDDEVKKLDGEKIVLNYKSYNNRFLTCISRAKGFYQFLKEHEDTYKVVHFQSIGADGFFDIIAAWAAGVPHRIAHSHIANDFKPSSRSNKTSTGMLRIYFVKVRQFIIRILVSTFSTDYMACSKMAADWMFTRRLNKKGRVQIVKNPINIDNFTFDNECRTKIRGELNINNKFVVGHVGRFVYSKNHEFLLKTFKDISDSFPNAVLLLVGEGTLKQSIMNLALGYNIQDKVIFFGETDCVNEIYNAFDIFLFPSRYEGLGIVLVEAQVNGLPIVASNTIPKEVKLTDNFTFLSLQDRITKWAQCVIEKEGENRAINNSQIVKKSGYDIKDVSKLLSDTYLRMNKY
jgi:Glycosyltransferase